MRKPIETVIVISVFVTSIFFGIIYFLSPFVDFDLETLNTSFFYLFSTNAQVLAALIGISYAILYTSITNMRSSESTAYLEPLKRLIMSDHVLKTSIFIAVTSIFISVLTIILINTVSMHFLRIVVFMFAYLVVSLSIISILLLCNFAFFRMKFYLDPQSLLGDSNSNNHIALMREFDLINRIVDYVEMALLIESMNLHVVKPSYQSLKYIEKLFTPMGNDEDKREILYKKLRNNLLYDINKTISNEDKRYSLYNDLIACAFKSLTDGIFDIDHDINRYNNLLYFCICFVCNNANISKFINDFNDYFRPIRILSYKEIKFYFNLFRLIDVIQSKAAEYSYISLGLINDICEKFDEIINDKKLEADSSVKLIMIEYFYRVPIMNVYNKVLAYEVKRNSKEDNKDKLFEFDIEKNCCEYLIRKNVFDFSKMDSIIKTNYINLSSKALLIYRFLELDPKPILDKLIEQDKSIAFGEIYDFKLDCFINFVNYTFSSMPYRKMDEYVKIYLTRYLEKYNINLDTILDQLQRREEYIKSNNLKEEFIKSIRF